VQPKYKYLQQFSEEDAQYFRQMPFSLSIPSHGVLVVHAGIVPGTGLEDQLLDDLINVSGPPLDLYKFRQTGYCYCHDHSGGLKFSQALLRLLQLRLHEAQASFLASRIIEIQAGGEGASG